MHKPVTAMAFDCGTRRVGVAVGNSVTKAGEPLKTIAVPNSDILFKDIELLLAEWQPNQLVVGRPAHPDGAPHEMTAKAIRFGNQLHSRFHLPVAWVDERYTSAVLEGDAQMRDNLDAHSAALILEQYFSELDANLNTKAADKKAVSIQCGLKTNAEQLYAKLLANLRELKQASSFELAGLAMGGAWIAERLAKDLGLPHYGVINVAFHRDDYAEKGMKALRTASTMATHLPFDVNGSNVILIDDVLLTGRTVRAALNELFDFGRPAQVELMVLADRGNRELPVYANFVGEAVSVPDHQILVLEKNTAGKFSFVLEERE